MAAFHDLLLSVHDEIWEAGTSTRPELHSALSRLQHADLPSGVTRLATAAMSPGPHLAAQDETETTSRNVVRLDARRAARARTVEWYALS